MSSPNSPRPRLRLAWDTVSSSKVVNAAKAVRFNAMLGFYYSTGNNYFLNRDGFKRIGNPLPGQVDVSDDDFNNLVFAQTKELWTKFGWALARSAGAVVAYGVVCFRPLFEIWFDHGVSPAQDARLKALLQQYQPNATGFNAQGLMPSPIKYSRCLMSWLYLA